MLDIPLRVGIAGNGKFARGVEFQVRHAEGMELVWRQEPDDVEAYLKNQPVDAFVEACGNVHDGAECSLLAIENHAHVILTNPRVDVAYGLPIQTEAFQEGIVVTSDIGTPHGALASMIQEAHFMGFNIVQAGQISPRSEPTQLIYEMAALANGFGFLPPDGGMPGSKVGAIDDALDVFHSEKHESPPQINVIECADGRSRIYLIVTPRDEADEEQVAHLRNCQLGDGPYYLLSRNAPLGHLETPKTILGAVAGQAILSPGHPTCDVYAALAQDLPSGSELAESLLSPQLLPRDESLVPFVAAIEETALRTSLRAGEKVTFLNALRTPE